jgi:hypothetical protein
MTDHTLCCNFKLIMMNIFIQSVYLQLLSSCLSFITNQRKFMKYTFQGVEVILIHFPRRLTALSYLL